jgi:rod shape-determining protein MreC
VDPKIIRRRRALLALLVAISLLLLTAYFGESPSSPLHSVQRGIVEVLSPVQKGASKILSPVRDIAGWFSDTFHARSERDQLRKENRRLTAEVTGYQQALLQNAHLAKLVGLDNSLSVGRYQPVAAQVIGRDPSLWYRTVQIDKGSADGVHVNDPVLGDSGLVGSVSQVGSDYAVVTLITDHSSSVTAQIQNAKGDSGQLVPAVGNPNQLVLQYLPRNAQIAVGQQVVTAGFRSGPLESLFPPGIPIGQVSNADLNNLLNNGQVRVTVGADLRHLDVVQVLTSPHAGSARASVP